MDRVRNKEVRSKVEVTLMDRVRNEEVRRMVEIDRELVSWVDHRLLRWFRRLERMDEQHLTKMLSQVTLKRAVAW